VPRRESVDDRVSSFHVGVVVAIAALPALLLGLILIIDVAGLVSDVSSFTTGDDCSLSNGYYTVSSGPAPVSVTFVERTWFPPSVECEVRYTDGRSFRNKFEYWFAGVILVPVVVLWLLALRFARGAGKRARQELSLGDVPAGSTRGMNRRI
jgi:hypothetical protein